MERLYVQNADGSEREVLDATEHAAVMAEAVAGTVVSFVSSVPPLDSKRLILNAANAAAHAQDQADRDAVAAEVRSRTFQVFRRAPNVHAKSPAEQPELVTLGDVGETFSPADLAQIRADLGANRLEPLP